MAQDEFTQENVKKSLNLLDQEVAFAVEQGLAKNESEARQQLLKEYRDQGLLPHGAEGRENPRNFLIEGAGQAVKDYGGAALGGAAKAMDYLGGLSRGTLGTVAEAVSGKDVIPGGNLEAMLKGEVPPSAEMLKNLGVEEGASLSDVLPAPVRAAYERHGLKGGILDPTARGAAGFALDVATDPLTWAGGPIAAALKGAGRGVSAATRLNKTGVGKALAKTGGTLADVLIGGTFTKARPGPEGMAAARAEENATAKMYNEFPSDVPEQVVRENAQKAALSPAERLGKGMYETAFGAEDFKLAGARKKKMSELLFEKKISGGPSKISGELAQFANEESDRISNVINAADKAGVQTNSIDVAKIFQQKAKDAGLLDNAEMARAAEESLAALTANPRSMKLSEALKQKRLHYGNVERELQQFRNVTSPSGRADMLMAQSYDEAIQNGLAHAGPEAEQLNLFQQLQDQALSPGEALGGTEKGLQARHVYNDAKQNLSEILTSKRMIQKDAQRSLSQSPIGLGEVLSSQIGIASGHPASGLMGPVVRGARRASTGMLTTGGRTLQKMTNAAVGPVNIWDAMLRQSVRDNKEHK